MDICSEASLQGSAVAPASCHVTIVLEDERLKMPLCRTCLCHSQHELLYCLQNDEPKPFLLSKYPHKKGVHIQEAKISTTQKPHKKSKS